MLPLMKAETIFGTDGDCHQTASFTCEDVLATIALGEATNPRVEATRDGTKPLAASARKAAKTRLTNLNMTSHVMQELQQMRNC